MTDYTDERGNHLFREMSTVVREQGSGYVKYYWQYYDQENRVEPKIFYVQGFEPCGWITGGGSLEQTYT
jgi:methyl-accepting chemotaxis protein